MISIFRQFYFFMNKLRICLDLLKVLLILWVYNKINIRNNLGGIFIMNLVKKVLIVTASTGQGHNSVADSLKKRA